MENMPQQLETADRTITTALANISMPFMRISLAVIYIWFGALKIVGASPVADFVSRTIPFLPKQLVVRMLGFWEVAIGLMLLFRVALRPTLFLLAAQIAGTFVSFIMQPEHMIQRGNPLRLTIEGEFVLKNIILLAAGMVVGSTVRREDESLPTDHAAK